MSSRQEKPGAGGREEHDETLKPAVGAQAGQPRTVKAESAGRKRVLRGDEATHAAKRRQRAERPRDSAPKFLAVEVGVFDNCADSTVRLDKTRGDGSTGVRERGNDAEGTTGT